MLSDVLHADEVLRCPTASEIGAAPDACEGPPPLPLPASVDVGSYLATFGTADPQLSGAEWSSDAPPPVAQLVSVELAPPPRWTDVVAAKETPRFRIPKSPAPKSVPVAPPVLTSRWQRFRTWLVAAVTRCVAWYREDSCWYFGSMAVHAIGLVGLALISLAIPTTILSLSSDSAPSFEAPKVDTAAMEISRFEVGDAPLEPTELNAETLAQIEPLPIGSPAAEPLGGQEARDYDDSPTFEEAGGGKVIDREGLKLGGLGGISVKNLPGPAGLGGVGVSAGFGKNPGVGGAGEGFGSRGKGQRQAILGPGGGTKASERAVGAALSWLARHQTAHGRWSLDFRHQCKGGACSGTGFVRADAAATSMALLPFLAAGETHKSKGPYKQTVAKGLAWLIQQQRSDGNLAGGADQPMYSHGLATLTLCEAYGMTKDEHLGAAARQGVDFIIRAQNETTGGWRYEPGDTGDTSVFGWQIMALKSAQTAGLAVDSAVFDNAQKWLHSVAKGENLGLYSYQPYREVTPVMTAVGMLCSQYLGVDPKSPAMLEGKRALLQNLPDGTLGRNTYYWYYATLAMHNFSDGDWDAWNRKMRRTLIETQAREGCATGSWDPEKPTLDAWGRQGGRLMTTSLCALSLEVYYRYLPLFRTDSLVPGPPKPADFTAQNDDTEKP